MFQAIPESLPIAFGIVLATMPLMAVPLTLVSRGAIRVLGWFLAGYAGGFVILGGAVILTADVFAFASGGVSRWMLWLRVLLGIVLLGLAWHKWQGRPRRGEEPAPPGWAKALDTLRSPGAAGLGFALVVLNPKNAVLVASGGLAIAAAAPAPVAQALALIVFTVVSGLGIAAPLLLWLTLGDRVMAPLNRIRGLLVRYDAQILAAVLAGLGLVVILNATGSL
jgi:cadmium resistance protein CadD (predicted permease)